MHCILYNLSISVFFAVLLGLLASPYKFLLTVFWLLQLLLLLWFFCDYRGEAKALNVHGEIQVLISIILGHLGSIMGFICCVFAIKTKNDKLRTPFASP